MVLLILVGVLGGFVIVLVGGGCILLKKINKRQKTYDPPIDDTYEMNSYSDNKV